MLSNRINTQHFVLRTVFAFFAAFLAFSSTAAHASTPEAASTTYRVIVSQDGFYRITYQDLLNAGFPVSTLNPQTLRLTAGFSSTEVAIEVVGDTDGRFDATDEIRFYGKARDSKYGFDNVYWLTFGAGNGLRVAQRDVKPTTGTTPNSFEFTKTYEQDIEYRSIVPLAEGSDHWFWAGWAVSAGQSQTASFTISVSNPVAGAASLALALQGDCLCDTTSPDHHVRVVLNGHTLGETTWDNRDSHVAKFTFDGSWLLNGNNVVEVTALGDTGQSVVSGYVDEMTLTYRRTLVADEKQFAFDADASGTWLMQVAGLNSNNVSAYKITKFSTPVRLVGGTVSENTFRFTDVTTAEEKYVLVSADGWLSPKSIQLDTPSALRNSTNAADFIIISYPEFQSALQPLVARRVQEGMRVALVSVQDVYDEFGGGVVSAEAIRDFLAYAYQNWQAPAPHYVLLVGDGTYDFKDVAQRGNQTFIPPFLGMVDILVGETAADNLFVDFNNDKMPEMAIGRFPVKSLVQAQVLVNKTLTYENTPVSADWLRKVALVADKTDFLAGDFPALSDQGLPYIPNDYSVDRMYVGTSAYPTNQSVNTALINAINSGRFLVNYSGHGDTRSWAGSILRVSNNASLTNASRLSIITTMGCEVGYFMLPYNDALSELLVTNPNGGAVATFAGSGRGTSVGQQSLYLGILDAVFVQGIDRLGDVIVHAKDNLHDNNNPVWHSMLNTFHLFGDPTLLLPVPHADSRVSLTASEANPQAGNFVTYTVAYSNTGVLSSRNTVVTVTLPSGILDVQTLDKEASQSGSTVVVHQLGNVPAGQTHSFQITGKLAPTLNPGTALTAAAVVESTSLDADAQDNISELTVTVGEMVASVGGQVFVDTNGNGIRDAAETTGLSNMQVGLYDSNNVLVKVISSGANGYWRINDISPGSYSVTVNPAPLVSTTSDHLSVVLEAGKLTSNVDFGVIQPTSVDVLGFRATSLGNAIQLQWTTSGRFSGQTFQLERADGDSDNFSVVSPLINATGTEFSWQDSNVKAGHVYSYRLVVNGGEAVIGSISAMAAGGNRLFVPFVSYK